MFTTEYGSILVRAKFNRKIDREQITSSMSTQSHIDKVKLKPNLMTYPHHVAAPKIQPLDLSSFNRTSAHKVSKSLQRRMDEIRILAEKLQEDYRLNQEVYSASYSFEPIVGETYHLYQRPNGDRFLSLISPDTWSMTHLYSVTLNSDHTWIKLSEKS